MQIARPGCSVYYETQGSPDRPTVVLLHNLFCSHHVYAGVVEQLRDRFHTVTLDFRGHGGSREPTQRFAAGDLADDVVAILDELKLGAVFVAGVSLGATVAMELALKAPARVKRLVLMGSSALGEPLSRRLQYHGLGAFLRVAGPHPRFVHSILSQLFGASYRAEAPEALAVWEQRICALDRRGASLAAQSWGHRRRLVEALASVRLPTRVVVGQEDVACPLPEGKIVNGAIVGSELLELPRAGHSMPAERPVEIARLISDHFHA